MSLKAIIDTKLLIEKGSWRRDGMMNKIDTREDSLAKQLKYITSFIALLFLTLVLVKPEAALATTVTGSPVSVAINYAEETAVITAGGGGSTKFFVSTDKGKNWEGIDGNVVDISTMLQAKEVEVHFKGNKDTATVIKKLMAEPTDLQVNYEMVNGAGRITYTSTSGIPVEYRKGANGNWRAAYMNMPTSLYELRGNTLYFRTVATVDRRNSKIVQVKIGKRPNAPSVKVDGGKLYVSGVTPGITQYRSGTATDWTTFSTVGAKIKYISLYDLLANKAVSNTPLPAGTIEFRNIGTGKKPTSAVKLIEVPLQRTCTDAIIVTGSTITITETDSKRLYEYTKVERTAAYDVATAKWSSIATNKAVKISKVSVGDRILIRAKSLVDSSKQVIPASTYKEIIIQTITP